MDNRSCFLDNHYVKALGTSPPQELICFRWGKVITSKKEKERQKKRGSCSGGFSFPIITENLSLSLSFSFSLSLILKCRVDGGSTGKYSRHALHQDWNSTTGFACM